MSTKDPIGEMLQNFWYGCMLSSAMPLERIEGDSVKESAKAQAKQAIEAYIAERVVEAQNNGVAWTISVVDDLHIVDSDHTALGHGQDLDRTYKGIKNTIRDRYKAETGIDPAPSYPIHVVLKSNERVKQ